MLQKILDELERRTFIHEIPTVEPYGTRFGFIPASDIHDTRRIARDVHPEEAISSTDNQINDFNNVRSLWMKRQPIISHLLVL
jgi:hypothetical protein